MPPGGPLGSRTGRATPAMQSLRLLVAGVMGSLVVMGVALLVVLGARAPAPWVVVMLLALGAAVHVLITATGYRTSPIPRKTGPDEARTRGLAVFRSLLMLRLALAESVAFMALVVSFLAGADRSVLIYAVGAAVSLLLLAVHVWPSRAVVDRIAAGLERDGARTGLHELLGLQVAPRPDGSSG